MAATPESTNSSTLALLLPKLMGLAGMIRNLAERFKGISRFLAVSGLLATLWLTWFIAQSFGLSLPSTLGIGLVLLLPALVLGWSWYILEQACDMPERLTAWLSQAKGYAGETLQRLTAEESQGPRRGKLGDLGKVGGLVYELRSMQEDTRDLVTIFGGSLALTNPLFLLVLVISATAIVVLDISAILTGLTALFR